MTDEVDCYLVTFAQDLIVTIMDANFPVKTEPMVYEVIERD